MAVIVDPPGPQLQPTIRIAEQVALQRETSALIGGAPWDLYDNLLRATEDLTPRPRLIYCHGELEIMAPPSFDHEHAKSALSRLIQTYAEERDIELDAAGSTTLRIEGLRGKEPDESFFVSRPGAEGAIPDIVVEVKVTWGGLDTLAFWHAYRVPEVWIHENRRLRIFAYQESGYEEAAGSLLLPGIPIRDLEELALISPTTSAVRELRRRCRTSQAGPPS